MRRVHRTLVLAAVLACGCSLVGSEGDQDGECNDALDNDGDDLYDCDDPDCADYWECAEGDADTDTDADADMDTDADSTPGATGDSWTWVPLEIDVVTYGYDAQEWFYSIDCIGWAENADLQIHQDVGGAVWEEHHDMLNTDYDPYGTWDQWEISLRVVTSPDEQTADESTLFAGDLATENTMTWMISAWEDGRVGDCVVWGTDIAWFDQHSCREITF